MSNKQEVILGMHFYQPPRQAAHYRLEDINPDPQGKDWTAIISGECYGPLIKLGVLDKTTCDYFGTLDHSLEKIDPDTRQAIRTNLDHNGVADPYIHPLLPDLSLDDKLIVVEAGIKRFKGITGKEPRYFFLPEMAVDTATLEVLNLCGIAGFFCAPDQVELYNRYDASNTPTRIRLSGGNSILAIPSDRVFSRQLAFDGPNYPLRDDAHKFAHKVVLPALDRLKNGFPLVGYVDGETFGHHMQWGGAFIDTLVNRALPAVGVKVVSINEVDMGNVTIAEGKIKERSAWSCSHGDLARWHGGCNCDGWDVGWKGAFYHGLHVLNGSMTKLVKAELGDSYREEVVCYFDQGYKNSGLGKTTPELSLISAKVAALTALTSCGTFYSDPGVSGGINILFARQAVEHLEDAGLGTAGRKIWNQFLNIMGGMRNPVNGRDGIEMAWDLLGDIATQDYVPAAA